VPTLIIVAGPNEPVKQPLRGNTSSLTTANLNLLMPMKSLSG
jgi:hypothetical protein